MKTQLFILNFEIELNEGVQFLLNKEFEQLSNPTSIINDWSKTVSIPFTEKNNKIFGYIYNPNRVIVSDGTETSYTRMGIYFDPTKKLDFRLVYNNFVLMEGYAKMLDIKMTDYSGSYNITLNGQLGKIFQEMKKITFDLNSEDLDYIIDCSQYWKGTISAQTVATSCNNEFSRTHALTGDWENYIGYILNNSFDDDFDYTCFQNTYGARKIENVLTDNSFFENTGIQPSLVLENGALLPRSFGEFRSYLQVPYLYMEKLWLLFQTKAEEITGYTFDLDSDWFDVSNPYWWNLCIILMRKDPNRGIAYVNQYTGLRNYNNNQGENWGLSGWDANGAAEVRSGDLHLTTVVSEELPGVLVHPTYRENKLVFGDNKSIAVDITFNSYLLVITQHLHINDTNGLVLELTANGESGASQTKTFLFRREGGSAVYIGATYIDVPDSASEIRDYCIVLPPADAVFNCLKSEYGDYVTFSWAAHWIDNSYPFAGASAQGSFNYYLGGAPLSGQPVGNQSFVKIKVLDNKWSRSGGEFILNDLWNNDFNIFDQILTYCKTFNLKWIVDNFEKKIYIKTKKNYFANYSINDWTDKVDKSKDFLIKPITFENKYVLFNYKDDNNELNTNYKDLFGINYGEYRLTTDYNFNSETKKLFDKPFKPSIVYSDTLLNYITLTNNNINYITQNEIFVFNRDKDKKFKDIFGCYFFYAGKGNILSSKLRSCVITDDTAEQSFNATYYYAGRSVQTPVNITTYNQLSNVYLNKLCLFNKPKKNYTYNSTLFDNTSSIYEQYWENYLNERYNIQNKVVTCYIKLSPKDWLDFEFNHFIKIDNILYIVNKIYDYNIESPDTVKVDLITITDINGYIN